MCFSSPYIIQLSKSGISERSPHRWGIKTDGGFKVYEEKYYKILVQELSRKLRIHD